VTGVQTCALPISLAALERAEAVGQPVQAVLMDVQMPGISGYETTRRLRERWSAAQLPVIALTAAALVSERERALAAGMSDFLTKPIDPPKLHAALLRALTAGARPTGASAGGSGAVSPA
jgi:CheY-like chemotaxis protein